jgi:uncharacterized protein (TIGR02246 family)
MFAPAVRFMIRRAVRSLNAGDIRPLLNSFSRDAVLVFPGQHSWAGEYRGRDEIEAFLRRFAENRLELQPQEILVNGWPWNSTVALRFTNRATDAGGGTVYENRGMIFARAAWGKIHYQEDFEDTQRVAAFDEYLASRSSESAA